MLEEDGRAVVAEQPNERQHLDAGPRHGYDVSLPMEAAGQLRLRNGSPVVIDDSIAPGNNPDPQVENN